MTPAQQAKAAKEFAEFWQGKGNEKSDAQAFWFSLLRQVFGMENPEQDIEVEKPVPLDHTSFIDVYIPATKVLIEQKSIGKDLNKGYTQSDDRILTPYQQAKRYANELPRREYPRWIVVCNFAEFHIHDMEHPHDQPYVVLLKDLEKEYNRLQFLVDEGNENIKREMEVSVRAGELVGIIYDKLLEQYIEKDSVATLKSLNILCVRLVFCLYAEDAGLFGSKTAFHDYLARYDARDMRRALIDLFQVLDTPPDKRDPYLSEDLKRFDYVNGGLFSNEVTACGGAPIIPQFTDELRTLLLEKASANFDWTDISPTIFGAIFESTINPETRRSGGMHYTSIENIHKVIDPLFLNDLKEEFETIKAIPQERQQRQRLDAFQDKLASLTFFDPACGSGNFLTESYISLRRLENEIIKLRYKGQGIFGDIANPIKVDIHQFYGIEINDFAVSVATTALWIAEQQMLQETAKLVQFTVEPLPLKSYHNIHEGNALRLDWSEVITPGKLNYIMGNPPFVGHQWRSKEQQEDMDIVFEGFDTFGKLDYVAAWYKKAADMMQGTNIQAAFVSTNSICQGESVATMWKPLFDLHNLTIIFAYQTFKWTNESISNGMAAVHCVIIGFCCYPYKQQRKLYCSTQIPTSVDNINGYLCAAPNVFIQNRGSSLTKGLPKMSKGSQATDGGYLMFTEEEREEIIKKYPQTETYIKRIIGADDFINNKTRYCLWLKGVSPHLYVNVPPIMERLAKVREIRAVSPTASVQRDADIPMLFTQIRQPETDYLVVPRISSFRRRYIPIGYLSKDVIANDKVCLIPDASLYLFGVLISDVHMAWMRIVAGRLKSDYSYTPAVYNNFPFSNPTEEQRQKIEQTAQAILDARDLYPECSLAELYKENGMPAELLRAHQNNDRAVMQAYGMTPGKTTESECVAELFRLYKELTK